MPPVVAAAGITAAAGIGSALIAGHSASSAANAQQDAANAGIDEQRREFDQTRTDLAPWLTAGQSALGGMTGLLGLNGSAAQQSAITGLQNGPLFQSLFRQGNNTILADAAATGGLRGGNTENSLANFGSDLLAQVIQMQLGNLGSISGAGLNAGGALGGFGANSANAISSLLGQAGAAKAGGILGGAQGITGALNGIGGFLGSPGVLSGIFGSGGGGGLGSFASSLPFGTDFSSIPVSGF